MTSRPRGHRSHISQAQRVLSFFLTILPLLLLITAFVLAAVSASSPEWSYRDQFNSQGRLVGLEYRSPFVGCINSPPVTPDGSAPPANATWVQSCTSTRSPLGLCSFSDPDYAAAADDSLFCHHLTISAQLLFAGCALLGASLVVALGVTAVAVPQVLQTGAVHTASFFPRQRGNGRHPQHDRHGHGHGHDEMTDYARPGNQSFGAYLTLLFRLLSALGGLTLFVAMLVGGMALVALQFPNGDWTVLPWYQDNPTAHWSHGPWLVGRAIGWCAAAAVLAGLASFCIGLVWEGPRVAVIEAQYRLLDRDEAGEAALGENGGEETRETEGEQHGGSKVPR
ncbi:hypothetical protein QBC46DRAFT_450353 [Diplogelasinospora grovesii]|uniref:Pali-domain-containing protein n=1 Tax=Diplogelasinospora grovesii TaxID=303347 RepID=A0AAN6S4H9_9PEZI|nr:hypothetical protein QBC46DRAFT_450353 [Diplogelasinospora grovesii]